MPIRLQRSNARYRSLAFTGGASTANSPSVRILRTGLIDLDTGTVEMWLRPSATAADNAQTITEGATYGGSATDGNLIVDSDSENTRGFILGLSAGRLYLGVNASGGARTLVGSTDLRDGLWHHCAVYRNGSSGLMQVLVDGTREDTITGPTGLVTYDGNAPSTDQYHYFAKEKLNLTFGYAGLIAEIRFSDNQRYSGATYTVPTGRFVADVNTIGLYHTDEQSGTVMTDSSGNGFHGELVGSPIPMRSSASPF